MRWCSLHTVGVSTSQPPSDTSGILSPARMMQHVEFARYPPPEPLAGLVDWFWSVRWNLPMGFTHRQDVVSQPGVNVSVGNPPLPGTDPPPGPYPVRCLVNGVSTGMSTRMLRAGGWNLAAKAVTGGFGAWVDDVRLLTDRAAPLADLLPLECVSGGGAHVDWAEVAAELGYADQAHLTREFTATIGVAPAAYARQQRPASNRTE